MRLVQNDPNKFQLILFAFLQTNNIRFSSCDHLRTKIPAIIPIIAVFCIRRSVAPTNITTHDAYVIACIAAPLTRGKFKNAEAVMTPPIPLRTLLRFIPMQPPFQTRLPFYSTACCFRNFLGEMPVIRRNVRLNWEIEPKPDWKATSAI